ncbi:minor capsid protein [Sporosarcina limicola]|uniref:SPP1 gp7 family putative phage head morphogenesis protein n=1 Tax=Sporosarcina limicola TaxID=34101 RepID=A0A927MHI7_9BACL|nr:minor capsid protein [Sporosarcina limicola]MBE1554794.1 SPP1 gp7 family putative phage head morphogenesis protein [Sporosarcina limicola]
MTLKKPSNAYWDKRANARMAKYHRDADATVKTVTKAYDKAQKDMASEAEKIFGKFAKDGNLSTEEAWKLLNETIPKAEWTSIKAKIGDIKDPRIKRQMLNRLNAPAYSARITRLEALKENTYLQSKIIADAEIQASTNGYIGTINDAYYRTMFDVQKGIGVGFDFATMPNRTIETILKNPWSGKQFSSRIWDNTDVLAQQITEVITAGFMSGTGTRQMRSELMERMNVGKHAANRLIRTETTYMANAAETESYKEAGIDEYMFLATLDNKTSKKCQGLDRKIFKVKDAMAGLNLPPMHPFCRSTTRAYLGEKFMQGAQRRARNPVTGKNELVPASMNYPEWRKSIDDKHGKDQVDRIEKQDKNKATDKKQFEKYKLIYGKDLGAKNFAEFQDLKYNKGETWENIKSQKQQVLNSTDYRDSFKGKFGNKEVREWYITHDKNIVGNLDRNSSIKEQAVQAHSARNKYRTEARLMMSDRKQADLLNETQKNLTLDELVKSKMDRKGLSKDEAYADIIETAGKTNKKVNERFKLE